jgi:hypothetical protein
LVPPIDISIPKYFYLNFLLYGFFEKDLKDPASLGYLQYEIQNYIHSQNPFKLEDFFEFLIRAYEKFLATSLTIKYNSLTGQKELDERDYFKTPKELEEELQGILDIAEDGDILDIDTGPIFIFELKGELWGEQFYAYQDITDYFLPSSAINAIEKYKISDRKDINNLYPELKIDGIWMPISYLPESQNPEETRTEIPFLFGDEEDSDMVIELNKDHLLYLISI